MAKVRQAAKSDNEKKYPLTYVVKARGRGNELIAKNMGFNIREEDGWLLDKDMNLIVFESRNDALSLCGDINGIAILLTRKDFED